METDFEAGVSEIPKSTTLFVESAPVQVGVGSEPTTHVSTYVEEFADIKSFLAKPQLLNSLAWASTDAAGTEYLGNDIASYLTSFTIWSNKISGFGLIRGDFVVRVELNASAFQQGKLLLHYLPCYANAVAVNGQFGKFKNKNLSQAVQHRHVEINCRDTGVEFRIPYVAPTSWYDLKAGYYDWGRLFLTVFSPLLTGPSAPVSQAYVDVSVFGRWENVELNAATVPQSSSEEIGVGQAGKARRRGGVVESKENQGPIESGLRKVAKVGDVLKGVPVIEEYAGVLSWSANIAAGIASALGWSKPRELDPVTVVSRNTFRYAHTFDGPDLAIPGGQTCLNKIDLITDGSDTNEDEMSFNYLFGIPFFTHEATWNVGAGPNTSIITQKISPSAISNLTLVTDTVGGHSTVYKSHAPFTYLSEVMNLWRGSIILTMKFVKTQLHTGRLLITFTPGTLIANTPSTTTSTYSLRTIVDIRVEDVVSIELPYLVFMDYLPTRPSGTWYSGQLDVKVLNDLRAPESAAQSVGIQFFWTPGKDFELAAPGGAASSSIPYIPQSSSEEIAMGSEMQGNISHVGVIGNKSITNGGNFHAERCIGERIMSIKQLLNKQTVINGFDGAPALNNVSFQCDPFMTNVSYHDAGTGTLHAGNIGGDLLSFLKPMYAFYRGSVRHSFNATTINHYNQRVFTQILPGYTLSNATGLNTAWTGPGYGASSAIISTSASATRTNGVICPTDDNSVFQHVPYYNRFRMSLNTYYNGVDTPGTDYSQPFVTLGFMNPTTDALSGLTWQRSCGEDFQLLFFTGCPMLPVSHT